MGNQTSSDNVTCGAGTEQRGNVCIVEEDILQRLKSMEAQTSSDNVTCGAGTELRGNVCIVKKDILQRLKSMEAQTSSDNVTCGAGTEQRENVCIVEEDILQRLNNALANGGPGEGGLHVKDTDVVLYAGDRMQSSNASIMCVAKQSDTPMNLQSQKISMVDTTWDREKLGGGTVTDLAVCGPRTTNNDGTCEVAFGNSQDHVFDVHMSTVDGRGGTRVEATDIDLTTATKLPKSLRIGYSFACTDESKRMKKK